jgi:hypothetical protein
MNKTIQQAIDEFAETGVYNKEHDICRFFPNTTSPFITGKFFRDAHDEFRFKMKMVSSGIDEFTPLEKFAIKVIILHLEEFLYIWIII